MSANGPPLAKGSNMTSKRPSLSPEEVVSSDGAAKFLGISVPTLERYRLTGTPAIPYLKYGPGKRAPVRYRVSDLIAFQNACIKRNTSET